MKPIITTLTLLLTAAFTAGAAELKIEWQNPEKFRDADYYYNGGEKSKKIVMTNLERYFTTEAKRMLPEGTVLEMTVTELDLAGDFEPWRSPSFQDIRIVKEIYPALIEFDYKYLGADGAVLSEGSERLRDTLIPRSIVATQLSRSENYPYVKTLVKDWMRKLKRQVEKLKS